MLAEVSESECKPLRVGSTTVYPHSDPRTRPVELGASIFVEANRHMMKAVKVCTPAPCAECSSSI